MSKSVLLRQHCIVFQAPPCILVYKLNHVRRNCSAAGKKSREDTEDRIVRDKYGHWLARSFQSLIGRGYWGLMLKNTRWSSRASQWLHIFWNCWQVTIRRHGELGNVTLRLHETMVFMLHRAVLRFAWIRNCLVNFVISKDNCEAYTVNVTLRVGRDCAGKGKISYLISFVYSTGLVSLVCSACQGRTMLPT